jgi:hypothetical protein
MAESHRRLLTRELEELLAGERETWSPRAVARAASRDARLRRPAATAERQRLREAWAPHLLPVLVDREHQLDAWGSGRRGPRIYGLVTALALRMRELAPELLALREQVDTLAERARGYITSAGLSTGWVAFRLPLDEAP